VVEFSIEFVVFGVYRIPEFLWVRNDLHLWRVGRLRGRVILEPLLEHGRRKAGLGGGIQSPQLVERSESAGFRKNLRDFVRYIEDDKMLLEPGQCPVNPKPLTCQKL
jgi:hypothetical protein